MIITYIKTPKGKYLFSFHRHDYNSIKENGVEYFIDGGFDYIRYNGQLCSDLISDVIDLIREQFTWESIYDKDNNLLDQPIKRLLKDLSEEHILNIIKYLIETNKSIDIKRLLAIILIMNCELIYRKKL